jgi:uncharacterized protein YutE (UPF0331/DUF86 family)
MFILAQTLNISALVATTRERSVLKSRAGKSSSAIYTEAVRNLARDDRFPVELVRKLERLPGFRNVVIHEYVALDLDRVMVALDELEPIEQFLQIARGL